MTPGQSSGINSSFYKSNQQSAGGAGRNSQDLYKVYLNYHAPMGVSSMNNSQTTPLSLLAPNQPSAPSDLSMVNRPPNPQSKSKNVLEPLPKISNATPY